MEKTEASNQSNQRTLLIVVGVLTIAIFALTVYIGVEQMQQWIVASGWFGPVISLVLYGALGASPIPSEPLTILISGVFGPFVAMMVAGIGNLLAALMEYYVGARIGDATSFEQQRTRLPFGLGRLPVHSTLFLLLTRLLPGYGPKFISVLSGVYRVPLWRYIWTTAVATFLGAAIFAYGGFEVLKLLPF